MISVLTAERREAGRVGNIPHARVAVRRQSHRSLSTHLFSSDSENTSRTQNPSLLNQKKTRRKNRNNYPTEKQFSERERDLVLGSRKKRRKKCQWHPRFRTSKSQTLPHHHHLAPLYRPLHQLPRHLLTIGFPQQLSLIL